MAISKIFFKLQFKARTLVMSLVGIYALGIMGCAPLISLGKKKGTDTDSTLTETHAEKSEKEKKAAMKLGIEQTALYRKVLLNKSVGVVSNQTGVIGHKHLVDTLLSMGVRVTKVFSPEHGFRGTADAGEQVSSTLDAKTGLPIMSLYGNTKKPTVEMMSGLDIMVFDIQDVGVRFYTYISTLHYVMEACAEADIPLYVLDRPNPNANYIDGPVLEKSQTSFIGMHAVPVVYGMTIGEYGRMINGEGWLPNDLKCDLTVIPLKNYTHEFKYSLPIPPSPNLKTDASIQLYPSLCFFEGTSVSVGRGTSTPFEIFGHPDFPTADFTFTPKSLDGAKNPLQENKICNGYNLHETGMSKAKKLDLSYFLLAQDLLKGKSEFITRPAFFNKLAGNATLIQQIQSGMSEDQIRESWQADLEVFKSIRNKYLLYE